MISYTIKQRKTISIKVGDLKKLIKESVRLVQGDHWASKKHLVDKMADELKNDPESAFEELSQTQTDWGDWDDIEALLDDDDGITRVVDQVASEKDVDVQLLYNYVFNALADLVDTRHDDDKIARIGGTPHNFNPVNVSFATMQKKYPKALAAAIWSESMMQVGDDKASERDQIAMQRVKNNWKFWLEGDELMSSDGSKTGEPEEEYDNPAVGVWSGKSWDI